MTRFAAHLLSDGETYLGVAPRCVCASVPPSCGPADGAGGPALLVDAPGRLRVASRSITIEPDDDRLPLCRVAYADLERFDMTRLTSDNGPGVALVVITSRRASLRRERGADHPYVSAMARPDDPPLEWRVQCPSTDDGGVPPALIAALSCAATERARAADPAAAVAAAGPAPLADRLCRAADVSSHAPFDPSWFFTLDEAASPPLWSSLCWWQTASNGEPGRFVVSSRRLYFQRLAPVPSGARPAAAVDRLALLSHPLAGVAAVVPRWSTAGGGGVEIYTFDPAWLHGRTGTGGHDDPLDDNSIEASVDVSPPLWPGPSALLVFGDGAADAVAPLRALRSAPALGAALPARLRCALSALLGGADPIPLDSSGGNAPHPPPPPLPLPASAPPDLPPAPATDPSRAWRLALARAWAGGLVSNWEYTTGCAAMGGRSWSDAGLWPYGPHVLGALLAGSAEGPAAAEAAASLDLLESPSPLKEDGPEEEGGAEGDGGVAVARPWRDLARPAAALHPGRLAAARLRLSALGGRSRGGFHWSSTALAPAHLAAWMVRAAPGHLIRLQGGRLDHADRLFASPSAAWRSVAGSAGVDGRELPLDLFLPDGRLLAAPAGGVGLGRRACGARLDRAGLPAWAAGANKEDGAGAGAGAEDQSALRFLAGHRLALEAERAGARLHLWLDCTYGAASDRGPEAERRGALHHPVCYLARGGEGLVGGVGGNGGGEQGAASALGAAARTLQAAEFGQMPRRLFPGRHPRRRWHPTAALGTVSPITAASPPLLSLIEMAFVTRPVRARSVRADRAADPGVVAGFAAATRLAEAAMVAGRRGEGVPLGPGHTAAAGLSWWSALLACAAAAADDAIDDDANNESDDDAMRGSGVDGSFREAWNAWTAAETAEVAEAAAERATAERAHRAVIAAAAVLDACPTPPLPCPAAAAASVADISHASGGLRWLRVGLVGEGQTGVRRAAATDAARAAGVAAAREASAAAGRLSAGLRALGGLFGAGGGGSGGGGGDEAGGVGTCSVTPPAPPRPERAAAAAAAAERRAAAAAKRGVVDPRAASARAADRPRNDPTRADLARDWAS